MGFRTRLLTPERRPSVLEPRRGGFERSADDMDQGASSVTVHEPCRNALPHEIPKTAGKLRELAEANGWTVAVTYARGVYPAPIKPYDCENVAVRMSREGRLVALWHNGRFHRGLSQSRTYTLSQIREAVTR